jgi:dUTP pyrophosphatase
MRIKPLHHNFVMPNRSTDKAGAFDIYMPEAGAVSGHGAKMIGLGFAAEVPENHVAIILPRSGVGAKYGIELNNTAGVIDSDYRGEWKVAVKTKSGSSHRWDAEDRLFQVLVIPGPEIKLELTDELSETSRIGGFGSTGA